MMSLSFLSGAVSLAEEKAGTSIFEYKKELSLTDTQEKNLRGILTKLQNYNTEKKKYLDGLRAELKKMIDDKADLGRIKVRLQRIAIIQADATYEGIASVRAIEKELTAAQLSRWRGMQKEYRQNLQQTQAIKPEQKKGAAK